MRRCRSLIAPLLLLLLLAWLLFSPWTLRFQFAPLNYWAAAALILVWPVATRWLTRGLPWRPVRITGAALAVLMAVPAVPIAGVMLMLSAMTMGGRDPSLSLLDEVQLDSWHYRLYRTDCGAPCSWGLLLRREYPLPMSVRIVERPLWTLNNASEGRLQQRDGHVLVLDEARVLADIVVR